MICGGAAAAAAWAANPMIISTTSSSSTTRTSTMMAAMTTIASNNTRKLTIRIRKRKGITTPRISSCCCYSSSFYPNINNIIIIKNKKKNPNVILMQWQDCKVKMDVEVPISVAYKCYSDREAIPRWMPFISTVKILEDKPDLSRWSLKYNAFGQDIEFSWLARNMQPIPNQKIHWRSLEGLPNRGAVRFYPKGPSSCTIELTVSYEVPLLLVPVASALQPFLESLLARGLERFAKFAGSYSTDSST